MLSFLSLKDSARAPNGTGKEIWTVEAAWPHFDRAPNNLSSFKGHFLRTCIQSASRGWGLEEKSESLFCSFSATCPASSHAQHVGTMAPTAWEMKVGGKGDNHALPVSLPDVSALGATKTEIIQRQNYEFRGNSHHLIWRPEDGQVSMAFCMDAFPTPWKKFTGVKSHAPMFKAGSCYDRLVTGRNFLIFLFSYRNFLLFQGLSGKTFYMGRLIYFNNLIYAYIWLSIGS